VKKPAMVISAAAVALLVVAVALVLRPGSDPVAAQQSSPLAAVAAGPAVARLGNQQVTPEELQGLLATVAPEAREQLRGNREALERWIRTRLAEKAVLEQADAQGWAQRPEIVRQTRAATEQIVFRDYLRSVSQVPAEYPRSIRVRLKFSRPMTRARPIGRRRRCIGSARFFSVSVMLRRWKRCANKHLN
jgi:peptidylprolyl isomerase